MNDRVYVVWTEGNFYNRQIFFKRSIDGGAAFGNLVNITNATTGDSFNPQIVASNKNVYLLWQSISDNGTKQLLFKRSINGGAAFDKAINLSDGQKDVADSLLYSSGNRVYTIWDDNSTDNSQIFFKRGTDGGAAFNKTLNLSNVKGQSRYPDITFFNKNVYVVWQDRIQRNIGIFFKRII